MHGGNFFGQPAAFAADLLSMVVAQVGNLAERQLDLLVDPHRNGGLPPMLAAGPGRQHGLQGVQLASTALIAEIRRDAMPASMQSIPTNLHNQDVIPLGNQAALRALDQARLLHLLVGSLAVGLRQAAYVGARAPTAPGCAAVLAALVAAVPRSTRTGPWKTTCGARPTSSKRSKGDRRDARLPDHRRRSGRPAARPPCWRPRAAGTTWSLEGAAIARVRSSPASPGTGS